MGSVFYVSHSYIDPFFTSGMLWIGYVVALGWMVYLLRSSEVVRIPYVIVYWGMLLFGCGYIAWWNENFSVQQFAFLLALFGVMWLFSQEKRGINGIDICVCVASVGAVEALCGIGQWIGWINEYNPLFLATGSFDNPAGYAIVLVVCLPFVLHVMYCLKVSRCGFVLAVIVVTVIIGGILISGSRTGIIAMVCVIVGSALHYIRWNRRMRLWVIRGSLVMGIVLLIGFYLIRRDSADGRLLVWRCTWELIGEEPILGHGVGSFGGQYMPMQAHYLSEHQDERHEWLAGNVKHPFNEYLKLWVEYGIVGLVVLAIGVFGVLRRKRGEDEVCFVARTSMLAVGVCGMFSYPLNYPSICCLLAMNGGLLLRHEKGWNVSGIWLRIMGVLVCIALFVFIGYWQRMERCWYRTSQLALSETMEVLPTYRQLYAFMGKNPLFLYNYGAELHARELWKEAVVQLELCAHRLNDTDVQLLLAECYAEMGDEERAERCLVLASQMCPNLFVPEYRLLELYRLQGRKIEAMEVAERLLEKPVKVRSYVVEKIRRKVREYLGEVKEEIR